MRYIVLFWFVVLAIPAVVHAQTLEIFLEKLKNHPQVEAILAKSESERELSEAALGLPDPVFSLGVNNLPVNRLAFDREMMTSKSIGFMQDIPNYNARKARSGIYESEAKQRKYTAYYAEARLKALFLSRLIDRTKLDALEELNMRHLALYKDMENYLKGQLEAGNDVYERLAYTDTNRIDVQFELNAIKTERTDVEEDLIRLVGEIPRLPLSDIKPVNWSGEAERLHPVFLARKDIITSDYKVKEADAAFDPDYGVRASYMQRDSVAGNGLNDMFTVEFTVSVPLWASSSQEPKLRAARAEKRGAEFAFQDMKRQWIKKMNVLRNEIDIVTDDLKLLQEKEKALQERITSIQNRYESGEVGYDRLLEAKISYILLQKRHAHHCGRKAQLIAEFNSHIAEENNL